MCAVTDLERARLRFDCFMQARQFSRPVAQPSSIAEELGYTPRQGITVDEALELAGKIEAFCMAGLE
jgi:hypothetical protein